jgi:hypothetical protein
VPRCHRLFTTARYFCRAQVVSSGVLRFLISGLDSFRDAYVRTGMNLVQSMVVMMIEAGRQAWRVASARRRGL